MRNSLYDNIDRILCITIKWNRKYDKSGYIMNQKANNINRFWLLFRDVILRFNINDLGLDEISLFQKVAVYYGREGQGRALYFQAHEKSFFNGVKGVPRFFGIPYRMDLGNK